MSLSSAPNLDRVATESARSRLTQAGRPVPLSTRPRHAMTFPLVALQFSLRLPNHNFCPSSDVAARELCQLYVRRAPRFEEQIPDGRQRERDRKGLRPAEWRKIMTREEKYARLLPIGGAFRRQSVTPFRPFCIFHAHNFHPFYCCLSQHPSAYFVFPSTKSFLLETVSDKFLYAMWRNECTATMCEPANEYAESPLHFSLPQIPPGESL